LKEFNVSVLSNWLHEEDSSWDKTEKDVGEKWGASIKDGYIIEYFKNLSHEKIILMNCKIEI
jgi:hypothetical protein